MKKIIKIIVLVLAVSGIASLAVLTEGFTSWDIRELNEDNLIVVDNYVDGLDDEREDGLTVEFNDDGVITVEGENEGTTNIKIKVADITLDEGEYTISSHSKNPSEDTYYLSIERGTSVVIADMDEDSTFEVGTSATYSVYIVVCPGVEIDSTFKPVLVPGDEAGRFYVIG